MKIALFDKFCVMSNYTLHCHLHLLTFKENKNNSESGLCDGTRAIRLWPLLPQIPARWSSREAHVSANYRISLGFYFMFLDAVGLSMRWCWFLKLVWQHNECMLVKCPMTCETVREFFAYFIFLFWISNSHTSGIFYIFAIKHGYNSLRNLYIQNISPWFQDEMNLSSRCSVSLQR